jgi:hypothetical protein
MLAQIIATLLEIRFPLRTTLSRDSSTQMSRWRLSMEAMNSGLDNPFRCGVCNEEYDDLAYEG